MSLGPKSNFIPVVYAGTKKKKKKKTQRRKHGHKKKIYGRRTST